jgi:hypothetical protein
LWAGHAVPRLPLAQVNGCSPWSHVTSVSQRPDRLWDFGHAKAPSRETPLRAGGQKWPVGAKIAGGSSTSMRKCWLRMCRRASRRTGPRHLPVPECTGIRPFAHSFQQGLARRQSCPPPESTSTVRYQFRAQRPISRRDADAAAPRVATGPGADICNVGFPRRETRLGYVEADCWQEAERSIGRREA